MNSVSITGKENITISSENQNVKLHATDGESQLVSKALKGKGPVEHGSGALKIMAPAPSPKSNKPARKHFGVGALTGQSKLSEASKALIIK